MTCGIYCIHNKINNNKYIGQSINIEKRFETHKYYLNRKSHHNQHLQSAWNKYGEHNFEFSILKRCKHQYLDRFEKMYIRQYNSIEDGYNITYGYQDRRVIHTKKRLEMSKSTTKTGIYGLSKRTRPDIPQGFIYVYKTYKINSLTSIDLNKLESKVKDKNLDWIIVDEEKAYKTYKENLLLREQYG